MPDKILIGGDWRQGTGRLVRSLNPATREVNAEIAGASAEDAEAAIQAGEKAWRDPAWLALKPHERATYLYKISALITERHEELAQLQMRDNGKPIYETRALVASAAGTFRYYAAVLETMDSELTVPRGPHITMNVYEPLGVVAGICPWNSPIASDAQKLAPALAAGNAMILKPAEVTPLASLALGRICTDAGLPKGLVSILPGPGSVIGNALVNHPLVRKVSFTGGTETGRRLAVQAAQKLMPVSLELGGKSPTIVFPDADVDHAINGILYGIFSSQGQSCIAGSRLFVHRDMYEAFVAKLVARTRALKVGAPDAPGTHLGPLISEAHRESVEKFVALGLEEGCTLLCGGARPTGSEYEKGNYYLPTVLAAPSNALKICQEEIFGPVLVVMPFDDEDDLIAQANDSVFGLACGIWTADYKRAWRIGRAVQAGNVWINTYKQFSISTPFGGFKDSGVGREKGRQGLLQWMQQKAMYWGLNPDPIPWAN